MDWNSKKKLVNFLWSIPTLSKGSYPTIHRSHLSTWMFFFFFWSYNTNKNASPELETRLTSSNLPMWGKNKPYIFYPFLFLKYNVYNSDEIHSFVPLSVTKPFCTVILLFILVYLSFWKITNDRVLNCLKSFRTPTLSWTSVTGSCKIWELGYILCLHSHLEFLIFIRNYIVASRLVSLNIAYCSQKSISPIISLNLLVSRSLGETS